MIDRESAATLLARKSEPLADADCPEDYKYRIVITTIPRWLHQLPRDLRQVALDHAPPLAGNRWDALLAAICEHMASTHGHAIPAWCNEPERFARPPWVIPEVPLIMEESIRCTPGAFIRHGAIPDVAELDFRIGEPRRWSPATADPRPR